MEKKLSQFAQQLSQLQADYTALWHEDEQAPLPDAPWLLLVVQQHQHNFALWHEEDKAREPEQTDACMAQIKRKIDTLNQARNDLIVKLDIWLAQNALSAYHDAALPANSESIGSIIDRLSIASLKHFHMQEQVQREDAGLQHVASCTEKLQLIELQNADLVVALQQFIDDIVSGKKQNKVYHQFKMYNDAALNPRIYNKQI